VLLKFKLVIRREEFGSPDASQPKTALPLP
jgi:hypothetical protein